MSRSHRRLSLECTAYLAAVLVVGGAAAHDGVLPPVTARFADPSQDEAPSFQRHVGPLFGRLGCNGRSCHGSFQGRGGFRLSLFGYDFQADHDALLDQASPRVDLEDPLASLILNKPTDADEHEGGQRFERDGWEHRLLLNWIQAKAPFDAQSIERLQQLRIEPDELQFTASDQTARLRAIAIWQDGSQEDVTPLCRFQSNDEAIATIDQDGCVTSHQPGDSHVVVFYDKAVQPVPVIQPVGGRGSEAHHEVAASTRVDALVLAKLRKLGIVPSELCDDAAFLRRLSLDLTGTLPSVAEVRAFLNDASPQKRQRKIDELLETPAYAAWWTTKLCDFTGNNSDQLANVSPSRGAAAQEWYDWIYRRVSTNTPYDALAVGIVSAVSKQPDQSYLDYCREMSELYRKDSDKSYADREYMTHYWARRDFRMPPERAISFAYAFLGIRIQCAQCHKHPFDQWSKQDFDQFAPFFAAVRLAQNGAPEDRREYNEVLEQAGLQGKRGNELRRELPKLLEAGQVVPFPVVFAKASAQANTNRNKKKQQGDAEPNYNTVTARVLGGEPVNLAQFDDPRDPLVQWLRDPANPLFARAFVNRVWATYFNVGIVNPPDDLSLANPPSNAALLDYLAGEFVRHGYDMKWLHREILSSDAYQRSWRPNTTNAQDQRNFSRAIPRRLPAEVAVDAIAAATMSDARAERFREELQGRAIATAGTGRNGRGDYALTVFGRSTRESNCDCDRAMEPTLLQTVYLQNDNEILARLNARDGWLAEVAGVQPPAPGATDSRPPPRQPRQSLAALQRRLDTLRKKNDLQQARRVIERMTKLRAQLAELREQDQAARNQSADGNEAPAQDGLQRTLATSPPARAPSAAFGQRQAELIEAAFLRALSRMPTPAERQRATAYLAEAERPADGLRDLLWALINTKEFIVNH